MGRGESRVTTPMPSVFVGHGNPMNAVQQNEFTDGWRRMAASIPKPRAILAISAHWYRLTPAHRSRLLSTFSRDRTSGQRRGSALVPKWSDCKAGHSLAGGEFLGE